MTSSPNKYISLGSIALVGSIVGWSAAPPMLKAFTGYIDGWTSNGIRYPFSALILLPILIFQFRRGLVPRSVWKAALLPATVNVIAQCLWAWLPYFINATQMSFLVRISVVFALTAGFLAFPEERKLMKRISFWLGCGCSLCGFLVMSVGGGALSLAGTNPTGILLVLVCGAFYGLYGVSVRYSMRGVRPWVAFPVISIYTSIALVILLFLFGNPGQVLDLTAPQFGWILFSSVIGIACAHTCFYLSIERLGVAISSGTQLIAPFLTFFWAFLFLGETLTISQWIGGLILLLGGGLLFRAQTVFTPSSLDAKKAPIEPRLPD